MRRVRLGVGLAIVLVVTALLAAAVLTTAAVSDELSDGDGCETGGGTSAEITSSPENVTDLAGNVTRCVAGGATADGPPG